MITKIAFSISIVTLATASAVSNVDDGLVMGPFYEGNDGTAIYNPNFRPFTSRVPLLLMRLAVISDWKFFVGDEAWLAHWGPALRRSRGRGFG